MNLTLYSVKNNDLQVMNVSLWILEEGLVCEIKQGKNDCHPWVVGTVGCGEKEERKSKVPFGKGR